MPECLLSIWKPWVNPPVGAAKLGLVLKSLWSQLSGDRGSRIKVVLRVSSVWGTWDPVREGRRGEGWRERENRLMGNTDKITVGKSWTGFSDMLKPQISVIWSTFHGCCFPGP